MAVYPRLPAGLANSLASRGEDVLKFNNNAPASSRVLNVLQQTDHWYLLGLMCGSEQKALRRKTYSSNANHCMQGELQWVTCMFTTSCVAGHWRTYPIQAVGNA